MVFFMNLVFILRQFQTRASQAGCTSLSNLIASYRATATAQLTVMLAEKEIDL